LSLAPLPKGGDIEAYPFISDRRTKEHNTPSLWEGWGGLHIIPRPLPKGGEIEAYSFISDRRTKGNDTHQSCSDE